MNNINYYFEMNFRIRQYMKFNNNFIIKVFKILNNLLIFLLKFKKYIFFKIREVK